MNLNPKSIRTFIGAKNFRESSAFYRELGFEETIIDSRLSYFGLKGNVGFYLQDAYVKDWVNNSMVFLEVEDLDEFQKELTNKNLKQIFKKIRISEIKNEVWGRELFVHDPSGILWHFGEFKKET